MYRREHLRSPEVILFILTRHFQGIEIEGGRGGEEKGGEKEKRES